VPALTPLIYAVSLELTQNLIAVGQVFSTLAVASASNASPIVVGTAVPHGIVAPRASVLISGVGGNTAANGLWLAKNVGPSSLALYSLSPTGADVPSTGNGAFTSAGQLQTALADGGIVIGKVKDDENWSPPRVVFIPRGSRFGPRSAASGRSTSPQTSNPLGAAVRSFSMTCYGGGYSSTPTVIISAPDLAAGTQAAALPDVTSNGSIRRLILTTPGSGYLSPPTVTITDPTGSGATANANLGPAPEALAIANQRPLWTDFTTFEVRVWASTLTATTPGSYEADFDLGQMIYQAVMTAAYRVAPGNISTVGNGVWLDSLPNATQMDLDGHCFRFALEFATPVLDVQVGTVNPGMSVNATLGFVDSSTGSVEVGVSGTM